MTAFLTAIFLVTVAEMGDKTQLLAMAFATRYSAKQVMIGVFVATIFNHALAVAAGQLLTEVIPIHYIQIAAAISFIGFGLWTIRGDDLDDEDKKKSKFGPIATVAIAFFIAELGDKTQLATIALAAKYKSPLWILMGTTCGMMIADGIGILFGHWLNKRVKGRVITTISAGIFIFFGLLGLYKSVPSGYINAFSAAIVLVVVAAAVVVVVKISGNGQKDEGRA